MTTDQERALTQLGLDAIEARNAANRIYECVAAARDMSRDAASRVRKVQQARTGINKLRELGRKMVETNVKLGDVSFN